MTQEMDYKRAYLEIVEIVAPRFPECNITTVDLVRMLVFENDALRMALKLPHPAEVVKANEQRESSFEKDFFS
jgi:hypothetical protein